MSDEQQELAQEVIGEALVPDLSGDTFEICGKTVKIKPLKLRYQIEFSKTLAASVGDVAYELDQSGLMSGIAACLKHPDVLVQLMLILAKNDGQTITEEEILDSEKPLEEIMVDLAKFAAKNETIGKPISDFFTVVLPLGREKIVSLLAKVTEQIQKGNFTFTA